MATTGYEMQTVSNFNINLLPPFSTATSGGGPTSISLFGAMVVDPGGSGTLAHSYSFSQTHLVDDGIGGGDGGIS